MRVAARPNEPVVLRQLNAIDRDVQALRERFRAGVFVGLAGPVARENTLRQRPCGRFARRDAQCADGLMLEYRVGNETRRFNVDTLVRAGGRWRSLAVRHGNRSDHANEQQRPVGRRVVPHRYCGPEARQGVRGAGLLWVVPWTKKPAEGE